MSRTPMYDPMTSDARSSWLAGLTEACNKISSVLDMKTNSFENLSMPELYISQDDRYRIYQAPLGNKLWLENPAPIIKKNGTIITPEDDGFTIDYLGGSIAFEQGYTLTEWDVITANATYIVDGSNKIESLIAELESVAQEAQKNKGAFETVDDLTSANPEGMPGDFAIISSENAIYIWDDIEKKWVNANAKVDLTQYFTKTEMEQLLNEKQDTILPKDVSSESGDNAQNYFYAGDKTWVSLLYKIRGCALSGLVTDDASQVEAANTLLEAIGKLQAQINSFIHPITGTSAPTTSTEGKVGQDYINTSNGDKYRLIAVDGDSYIWQKYGKTSVENFTMTIPVSVWKDGTCTITDSRIQLGDEYTYFVGPADASYTAYNEAAIHADDLTTDREMTFHTSETPNVDISVDICKMDGSTNGKVYNVGSGGGSSKNLVTVDGGGHFNMMEEIFGPSPYEFEFTEEENEDLQAEDILFDNENSGLSATNVQSAIDKVAEKLENKQDALTGQAGQVVGFGADGAAVAVKGWSNPNLLENAYWANIESIINQKGQKEYTNNGYCIDRWYVAQRDYGTSLTVDETGIIFEVTSKGTNANGVFIYQISSSLKAGTYTFSVLANRVNGSAVIGVDRDAAPWGNLSEEIPLKEGLNTVTFTITNDEGRVGIFLAKRVFDVASFEFVAAKFEPGSQQTLAHQDTDGNWVLNDPPPDKTLELLKCQRYQFVSDWGGNYTVGFGVTTSTTTANIYIPVPVKMRAAPEINLTDGANWSMRCNGQVIVPESISKWGVGSNCILVRAQGAFPAANMPVVITSNSAAKVIFDANL